MGSYTTDLEYRAAKSEIGNALAALDRMGVANATEYLGKRLSLLNDQQVKLSYGASAEEAES